jgi:hypothetical protein
MFKIGAFRLRASRQPFSKKSRLRFLPAASSEVSPSTAG